MCERRLERLIVLGLTCTVAACGAGRASAPAAPPPPEAPPPPPVSSPARAEITPRNGLEVVGAMRRTHPSRALHALSFTQSTIEIRTTTPPPRTRRSRVFAALPGKQRIIQLPTTARSGSIRDRQRLAVFERGRRVTTSNRVDLAMLLAFDVYAQSIDTTIMWLDAAKVRMGLARRDMLDRRRVWVVGAEEGDEKTAQFWVDADQWRVVRVIQRDPRAPSEVVDIRFTEFTESLDVPVPARIDEYRAGLLTRQHEISGVEVNPTLPAGAFDLSRWREVRPGS